MFSHIQFTNHEKARHTRWPSIELLHNVVKWRNRRRDPSEEGIMSPVVTYRAKPKIDGTNGGIQVFPSGHIAVQSRTTMLSAREDNAGFFRWAKEHEKHFAGMAADGRHLTIFGEWCGMGIKKGTAICQIGRKVLAVFGAQIVDLTRGDPTTELFVHPERIQALVPEHPDIFVLPWFRDPISLDFSDEANLEEKTKLINEWIAEVEGSDPWISAVFGIRGVGEGLVFYPFVKGDGVEPATYMELAFKAKGEKHAVVRQKKPAMISPEVARSVEAFVDMFVTSARLEQGVDEACGGTAEPRKTGAFLKWTREDVLKESTDELAASGLEWRQVEKALMQRARTWFLEKANQD